MLPLPMRAHAHLSMVADDAHFNYSHRIHRFAFEDDDAGHAGLVQPLEGDEVLTDRGAPSVLPPPFFKIFFSGVYRGLFFLMDGGRFDAVPVLHQRRADRDRVAGVGVVGPARLAEHVAVQRAQSVALHRPRPRLSRHSRHLFQVKTNPQSPSSVGFCCRFVFFAYVFFFGFQVRRGAASGPRRAGRAAHLALPAPPVRHRRRRLRLRR